MKPRNSFEQLVDVTKIAEPCSDTPCGEICNPSAHYCMARSQAAELIEIGVPVNLIPSAARIICESLVEIANETDPGPSIDTMTGLIDRRTAELLLPSVLGSLKKRGESLALPSAVAVLFIDLDGFKAVNDSLGHPEGDALLGIVGNKLNNAIRDGDFAARWGGDEFVIFALVDNEDSVQNFGDRVLSAITLDYKGYPISASIGAAVVPKDTVVTTMEATLSLNKADKAMYEAKRQGKGRVVVWE